MLATWLCAGRLGGGGTGKLEGITIVVLPFSHSGLPGGRKEGRLLRRKHIKGTRGGRKEGRKKGEGRKEGRKERTSSQELARGHTAERDHQASIPKGHHLAN